jgi:glycosyltransferase involved in cell wall biosynthesis
VTRALLTALMPVRDYHPPYLRAALDSLRDQSSPDWELLVIAEPEDLGALAAALADDLRDPRIELIANDGRRLAGAFNTGMRRSRTEFVAILLADDMWAREAVAVLGEALRVHPEVDFLHSSRRIVDGDGQAISSVHRARETFSLAEFARGGSPVKHLLCWRRSTALALGGMDETLNSVGPDDFDFPWSMAEAGARFRAIPECLYLYRDHRECFRLTTHLPASVHARELRRILRKHGHGRLAALRFAVIARRTYLRQCLYRSPLEQRVRERLGLGPRRAWRDTYV